MTTHSKHDPKSPYFTALLELIGRTGASEFTVRYSEADDDEPGGPVVWLAIGKWGSRHEVAAALSPVQAATRLAEQVIDGGQCKHCGKPTGFDEHFDTLPMSETICWYQWDPELETIRRGCE